MTANIYLGFKDLWKHKLLVLVCVIYLSLFSFIATILIYSIQLDAENKEATRNQTIQSIDIVATDTNLHPSLDNIMNLSSFYNNGAASLYLSQSYGEIFNGFAYLVLGDGTKFDNNLKSTEGISLFSYLSSVQEFTINDITYPVTMIPYSEDSEFQIDTLFILYQTEEINKLINRLVDISPYLFYEILEMTRFSSDDIQLIEDFKQFVSTELDGISIKESFNLDYYEYNTIFIMKYLTPFIIILGLLGIFSFISIFSSILVSMRRELTIHILHGADKRHVLLRALVLHISTILISLGMTAILSKVTGLRNIYVYYFAGTILLITTTYTYIKINRSNLFENLRGDYL